MISIGRVRPTYKVETPGEVRMRMKPDGKSCRVEQCWCVQIRDSNGTVLECRFEWHEVKQVAWDGTPIT